MSYNKEHLIKLLKLVLELCQEPGNEWFRKELCKRLFNQHKDISENNILENQLINDLKRSKYYLRAIDKSFWVEGLSYYSSIKDSDLKLELVVDYKEMKIADKNDDIIEYTRRIVMQLENCLNAVCKILNVYEKIQATPEKFKNARNDLLIGEYSFFDNGGSKALAKVSMQSKIFFAKQYYDINYSFRDMNQMITIRNKSSHRGEWTDKEREILELAKNNIVERKARFFSCYDTFWNKLKDLNV